MPDAYEKNEPPPLAPILLACWHGYAILEKIREYSAETGQEDTIGHFWLCLRRFQPRVPPATLAALPPGQQRVYRTEQCGTCRIELTDWKEHFRVNFKKTRFSKTFFKNWMERCLASGKRSFTINEEEKPIRDDCNITLVSSKPHDTIQPVQDNPNRNIEPAQEFDLPF